METIKITVKPRERIGKEGAKKYRRDGDIPAIIYGKKINMPVNVARSDMKILKSISFSPSTIIDMNVMGGAKEESFSALIRDVQYHPLTEEVIHIDFLKVNLKEKIKVHVPVFLKGEAKGTKDGGIVEQLLHDIELEGLPLDIPQKIDLDITELAMGYSLHVSDVKISENIKVVTALTETIVAIVSKTEEVVATVPEEGAPTGPEVIKEKKEGEEGEGEGEEKDKADKGQEKAKEESKDKPKEKAKEEQPKEKK